jgi:hypothetical protein
MTTKRNAKLMTSDSVENTESEPLTTKRTAALKAIGEEETKAQADSKSQTALGATEFGMPILPTSKADVPIEGEATRITSVPPPPANAASDPEPSPVRPKEVKAVIAKKQKKETTKAVEPKADTATLFANFKAAKMVNPFKETVKDYQRFNAVAGAERFEEALPGFKDEKDLKAFIAWVLRGTPGYKK